MPPDLARRSLFGGQERGEAALQRVRAAAHGVARIAVVRAAAVEAHIVGRGHEERLEQLPVSDLIDLCRHVQRSPGDRHRSAEPQEPARTSQLISKKW